MIINSFEEFQKLKYTDYFSSKCKKCNKDFTVQKRKRVKYSSDKVFLCKECLKKENQISKYGSVKAAYEQREAKKKETCLQKYGVEYNFQRAEFKVKAKEEKKEKYNDENYNNRELAKKTTNLKTDEEKKEIAEKTKETLISKYGSVETAYNQREEKKRKTCLQKYGVEYNLQREEVKEKTKKEYLSKKEKVINASKKAIDTKKEKGNLNISKKAFKTFFERTGYAHPMQMPKIAELVKQKNSEWRINDTFERLKNKSSKTSFTKENNDIYCKCNSCGNTWKFTNAKYRTIICDKCYPKTAGTSIGEKEVAKYIKSQGFEVEENTKKILNSWRNPELKKIVKKDFIYEIDLYIPALKIAIEYDGLYWHKNNDTNEELLKTKLCEELGIRLIHINDFDWKNKENIMKSIICFKKERIYARKCDIKLVNSKEEKTFLNSNHHKGYIPSSKCLGLYYNNELVQMMSFGKSRYNKKYDWELLREASKLNTIVIGGCSKLFKKFTESEPGSIISYCDYSLFNGKSYEKMGMKFERLSKPNYYYFLNSLDCLHSREEFQKHKLKDKLDFFDESLTEWENMQINGYNRFFDCGQKVYVFQGGNK